MRLPLNPHVPALAQHKVSPLGSVMVTVVLLKVAWMWATPETTLRRCFFLVLTFDTFFNLLSLVCWASLALYCTSEGHTPCGEKDNLEFGAYWRELAGRLLNTGQSRSEAPATAKHRITASP